MLTLFYGRQLTPSVNIIRRLKQRYVSITSMTQIQYNDFKHTISANSLLKNNTPKHIFKNKFISIFLFFKGYLRKQWIFGQNLQIFISKTMIISLSCKKETILSITTKRWFTGYLFTKLKKIRIALQIRDQKGSHFLK